jgi:hypothetical protein
MHLHVTVSVRFLKIPQIRYTWLSFTLRHLRETQSGQHVIAALNGYLSSKTFNVSFHTYINWANPPVTQRTAHMTAKVKRHFRIRPYLFLLLYYDVTSRSAGSTHVCLFVSLCQLPIFYQTFLLLFVVVALSLINEHYFCVCACWAFKLNFNNTP